MSKKKRSSTNLIKFDSLKQIDLNGARRSLYLRATTCHRNECATIWHIYKESSFGEFVVKKMLNRDCGHWINRRFVDSVSIWPLGRRDQRLLVGLPLRLTVKSPAVVSLDEAQKKWWIERLKFFAWPLRRCGEAMARLDDMIDAWKASIARNLQIRPRLTNWLGLSIRC